MVSGLSLRGHVSSPTHRRVAGTTGMAYRALVRVWNSALIATRLRQGKASKTGFLPAAVGLAGAALNRLDVHHPGYGLDGPRNLRRDLKAAGQPNLDLGRPVFENQDHADLTVTLRLEALDEAVERRLRA